MHWLLQGIISGVVSTFIATSLLFLIKEKWGNNLIMSGNHNQKLHISKLNPFGISVFITALFTALSGFSFYYQWVNMPYIITITIFFWFGSGLIYQYQCPKCNKIFIRITHQPDVLKEEKRPFRHRDCTITTYTDGSIKDRKYHGKEKVRMETWRLQIIIHVGLVNMNGKVMPTGIILIRPIGLRHM